MLLASMCFRFSYFRDASLVLFGSKVVVPMGEACLKA